MAAFEEIIYAQHAGPVSSRRLVCRQICTAGTVCTRTTTTGKDISSLLRTIVRTERQHLPIWIVDNFNQYIALESETRNSAVFNVNMALAPWNNGLISAATETSDFDIRELRRQPMTIFIGCTITELSIFRPLIRILFQQPHGLIGHEAGIEMPGQIEKDGAAVPVTSDERP